MISALDSMDQHLTHWNGHGSKLAAKKKADGEVDVASRPGGKQVKEKQGREVWKA
jgi:hypothetical protein